MMGFFKSEEEVKAAKEAYDKGEGGLVYLNFMPRAFDEGAAYYYSARGTIPAGQIRSLHGASWSW